VIAVDTNILVYAHRRDSEWHEPAKRAVAKCAESRAAWSIPWPCVHEFISAVTKRLYLPPTPLEAAFEQVEAWLESPSLVLLGETDAHWRTLRLLAASARISGGAVHDARIVALCVQHGVSELWSADRDFSRYGQIKVVNPLLAE
jgi:toxin-antitoxin system PIN domain toxin